MRIKSFFDLCATVRGGNCLPKCALTGCALTLRDEAQQEPLRAGARWPALSPTVAWGLVGEEWQMVSFVLHFHPSPKFG